MTSTTTTRREGFWSDTVCPTKAVDPSYIGSERGQQFLAQVRSIKTRLDSRSPSEWFLVNAFDELVQWLRSVSVLPDIGDVVKAGHGSSDLSSSSSSSSGVTSAYVSSSSSSSSSSSPLPSLSESTSTSTGASSRSSLPSTGEFSSTEASCSSSSLPSSDESSSSSTGSSSSSSTSTKSTVPSSLGEESKRRDHADHEPESSGQLSQRGYLGSHTCLICGTRAGSYDYTVTDFKSGTSWVTPEGYLHYIAEHGVRPSPDYEAFILSLNLDALSLPLVPSPQEVRKLQVLRLQYGASALGYSA